MSMKNSDLFFSKIKEIYNISPIDNIKSIFEYGLLSFNNAKTLNHTSVANQEIQGIRDNKIIGKDGSTLHDYASCYFNARNAMLYRVLADNNECVILVISLEVLDLEGTVVSDRNAAVNISRFYTPSSGFNTLDFDTIFSDYWVDENHYPINSIKEVMQAEVLVKNCIPPTYFKKIIVPNQKVRDHIIEIINGYDIEIEVDNKLFFEEIK